MTQVKEALQNVKIADFTWVGVGPSTVKYLADHGAQVIHIESATRPGLLRTTPPFKDRIPGLNRSAYQACFNNDKYGLALNLSQPQAREVLERIVGWADVIAESFAPGTMAKLGVGYEDLIKVKPDIIMYSTSQQGQTGPRAKIAAYGTQLVALSGFTALTGWPEKDPAGPYGPYTDTLSPSLGAAAIITALIKRKRTGEGTHIDLSQYEAGVNYLSPVLLDYTTNGRVWSRQGNRVPYATPHNVYPCLGDDRWCAIAVFSDEEWQQLCMVMNKPELIQDERFITLSGRKSHEDELDGIISEWTSGLTAEEVMDKLQKAGIAAGIARTGRELLESDPQLTHRRFFQTLEHSEIGKHHYERPAFRLSETPCELKMAGACIGEHNEFVCRELLGFSDEEYVSLVVSDVLT